MARMFCALGCSPTKNIYVFPSRKYDKKRRKVWLDFFDMEEPNIGCVFACDRHFSHLQTTTKGLRSDAVPDIPVICNGEMLPFKRKPKNWRKNVVVVTPRDPEFTLYRHETGVFPQNLFNIPQTVQPVVQMPMIKSVSCSMSTQTNTRLCGLVQISDIKEEYRLNCFYCSEMFDMEKWPKFVEHLNKNHFKKEAFKKAKYLPQDHDYASISLPSTAPFKSSVKFNMFGNSLIHQPSPQPVLDPVILPSLLSKPRKEIEKPSPSILKNTNSLPPPLVAKPHQSIDKPFNISLADQLIKLLDETILNPNFLHTEEDNILIIKNTGSANIESSNFLANIMNTENSCTPSSQKTVFNTKLKSSTPSTKFTRPIYTINSGQRDIPSKKYSLSRVLFPPLPKTKMSKLIQKRIAQQTLKNINIFEHVYRTFKKRHPKVAESDPSSIRITEPQIPSITPLSRFLKRTISAEPKKPKSSEIVFEYTPDDIIVSLLESMKHYPVLWEFHDQPFNKTYNKAIEELCRTINDKWGLNITLLKMRRSINRILRFYRFMLPCESIDTFEDYFNKCALFLPSSADAIPRARCVYCCICYKKDSELRKHILGRHKSLKWPYKCQHCYERFRESDEYELHKRLPHYEEIFKCEQCDKRFNRRHLYNKHVGSHQRSKERRMEAAQQNSQPVIFPHVCKVCQRQYRSLTELNHHIFKHYEKFICELCEKEFSSKMSLKLHLKRHRKELDFICEVCGKGFIRQAYLNEHMDTHTGAKITCNICNLKLRKCSLSRHLRLVHVATEGTIESTFRGKSYRYKKFLFPKQKKRGPQKTPRHYICRICKINFDRLKLLKDHNKEMHSDVDRTPCKICNIQFIHLQNLKRHYRAKHKLHMFQVFKLVYENEDLSTVLAMKSEELEPIQECDYVTYTLNKQDSVKKLNYSKEQNYFEQERMHSDKIQDEIMKAVESIDEQEIKVDDEHSMNEFFTDLLKRS